MTLNAGENTLTIIATDKAGNTTTETEKITFDPKAQAALVMMQRAGGF